MYSTTNKSALIDRLTFIGNLNNKDSKQFINSFFESINEALCNDENVSLKNFGTFNHKTRKARNVTHPNTSEVIVIPETKTVGFKPSKELISLVNKTLL